MLNLEIYFMLLQFTMTERIESPASSHYSLPTGPSTLPFSTCPPDAPSDFPHPNTTTNTGHLTPVSTCSPADTPAAHCLISPSAYITSSPAISPRHFVMFCSCVSHLSPIARIKRWCQFVHFPVVLVANKAGVFSRHTILSEPLQFKCKPCRAEM